MTDIAAIRISDIGGPDVMALRQLPLPEPGPGQIRVRHSAIGVNYIDTYHRSGLYPLPLPSGIGLEGAGMVEALGEGVTLVSIGDRVAYCTGPIGAYAEAHIVGEDRVVRLPDMISDDQAAASLLKGLTVQYLIRRIYPVAAGETVLFHAGAGGVGQIAIQWLKHLGASVITTVGSAAKAEIARDRGADHVIDYSAEEIARRVREITGGAGLPVVYDGVGQATWTASLDCLRQRGLMVSFGNASGPVRDVDVGVLGAKGSLFLTRPSLLHYVADAQELQDAAAEFFAAVTAGGIEIAPPGVRPLAEAAAAHRDLEGRRTTGSVILRP